MVRLMVVCLPLHGHQSSRLLCIILNALLMHLAPTHLQSQRKLMSILRGTRCWIRGSKWKRFRISHITGTENRSKGREGVKERPTPLPVSTHQPQWDTLPRPLEALGADAFWSTPLRQREGRMWFPPLLFCYGSIRHRIWESMQTPVVRG